MPPEVQAALENMAIATDEALGIMVHITSEDDWQTLSIHRLAVERCLIKVGEEAFQLTKRPEAEHPPLPLQQIASLRHRLVHDYLRIDSTNVYRIARDSLPALRASIQALLDQTP
jgi:uncharacterized protein with HEPN domain